MRQELVAVLGDAVEQRAIQIHVQGQVNLINEVNSCLPTPATKTNHDEIKPENILCIL